MLACASLTAPKPTTTDLMQCHKRGKGAALLRNQRACACSAALGVAPAQEIQTVSCQSKDLDASLTPSFLTPDPLIYSCLSSCHRYGPLTTSPGSHQPSCLSWHQAARRYSLACCIGTSTPCNLVLRNLNLTFLHHGGYTKRHAHTEG
jgi:hypothetical protein